MWSDPSPIAAPVTTATRCGPAAAADAAPPTTPRAIIPIRLLLAMVQAVKPSAGARGSEIAGQRTTRQFFEGRPGSFRYDVIT
jgi:hypothetical protein